jgi:hypothetical protein
LYWWRRDEEKQELKNVFSLFVMILVNGMRKTNVLNCLDIFEWKIENGQNVRVFPFRTGQNLMCGVI